MRTKTNKQANQQSDKNQNKQTNKLATREEPKQSCPYPVLDKFTSSHDLKQKASGAKQISNFCIES